MVISLSHSPVYSIWAFFPDIPLPCHALRLCTAASILPSWLTLWGFVTILPDFSASVLHTPLRGLFLWIIDHLFPPSIQLYFTTGTFYICLTGWLQVNTIALLPVGPHGFSGVLCAQNALSRSWQFLPFHLAVTFPLIQFQKLSYNTSVPLHLLFLHHEISQ